MYKMHFYRINVCSHTDELYRMARTLILNDCFI